MEIKVLSKDCNKEIARIFSSAFSLSEGEVEGKRIGELASKLCSNIDNDQILLFGAFENGSLIGSVCYTRLQFDQPTQIYMLAPVAVVPEHQGTGVGQNLITHSLKEMNNRSVTVATTYGDPSYYSKVGFQPLSETTIAAPLELSMPEGWLGQSLTGMPIPSFSDRPRCVEEFNDPACW